MVSMNSIILMLVLPATVAAIMLWLVGHAPEGYEDKAGFHAGREPWRLR
jgi:hypothetical protein